MSGNVDVTSLPSVSGTIALDMVMPIVSVGTNGIPEEAFSISVQELVDQIGDNATPKFIAGAVSNLPFGDNATFSLSGTADEPIMNFGIPGGEPGAIGPVGPISFIKSPIGATTIASTLAIGSSLFWATSDIIPEQHLSMLYGNKAPKLALMSDSTGTPDLPDANGYVQTPNAINPSQVMWNVIKSAFRNKNPGISWNFDQPSPIPGNFAIGTLAWDSLFLTGAQLASEGITLPSWWTDQTKTWLQIVEAYGPDILLFDFGINFAEEGYIGGNAVEGQNAVYYITLLLTTLNTWSKVPNVIFITNKVMNSEISSGSGSFDPGPQGTYFGVAGAIRTACRSNGSLWSALHPRLQRLGLIDFGRAYVCLVRGKDPANQFMQLNTAYVANGLSLSTNALTVAQTTDGDFSITLVFPGMGGGGLPAKGVTGISISLNNWANQVVILELSGNNIVPVYTPVFFTSPFSISGNSVAVATGDITVQIIAKAERMSVIINGTIALDASVPRSINGGAIIVTSLNAPGSTVTFNVTEFLDGIAAVTPIALTEDYFFGGYGATQPAAGGIAGGNGANHPSSIGVAAVDNALMQALNLSAPRSNPFSGNQQIVSPASGSIVQIEDDVGSLVVQSGGPIAELRIQMPEQPTAIANVELVFQASVAALTILAPNGYSMGGVPITSAVAGQKNSLVLIQTAWV